jgi:hypothetical protein
MITRFLAAGILLSTLVISLLGTPGTSYAQGRIALVVGNSAYSNVSQLANPANDAVDVSRSLQRLGFDVTTITDAKFDVFRRALIDFGRAARGADMAILFFAGHGVEIMGDNWLLPTDAELRNDIDVDTEAVNLRSVMLSVSNAKLLGLVILDACRNNPFAGKMRRAGAVPALDPGLAPVEPGENVLVAYAARDGTTASDGAGRNSPYTTALLHHLETPGLEIEFLFRNVRDDVMTATNDEQQPFVYGSLSREEIFLKEGPGVRVAYNAAEVMSDAGEIAWSFLRRTSDIGTLRRFVEQFPSSVRLPDARTRIAALESTATSLNPSVDSPGKSYTLASDSVELDTLTRQTARPFLRNTPAVDVAWQVIKDAKDPSIIRRFAEQFPSRQRQVTANQRLIEIGESPTIPRDLLLRAATDPDVLQCYRVNDIFAPDCQRALERFPDISRFVSDFRFRFALCKLLGGLGHCNDVVGDAWSRPLFHPGFSLPRLHRPWGFGSGTGKHTFRTVLGSKGSESHRANKEKSSKLSKSAADDRHGKPNSKSKESNLSKPKESNPSKLKESNLSKPKESNVKLSEVNGSNKTQNVKQMGGQMNRGPSSGSHSSGHH